MTGAELLPVLFIVAGLLLVRLHEDFRVFRARRVRKSLPPMTFEQRHAVRAAWLREHGDQR